MRSRTFLGIVIIVFLIAVLGLFAYELYNLVTSAQAPSSPVTAPATPTEVASPSPATSPTPTIGQVITQAEKDIFDPITALLDFAAVSLIAILVIFLFQRIWHLTGQSNLVLDTFNNASGKDEVTNLLPGLNGITRERLAQVLEEVRKRINPNRQSEKKDAAQQDQEKFRLDRFPVPRQASDEQLSKLLTALKDVSTGNVSTAVQLLNLIFTPRGTKITVTLQSKAETPSTLGISLEVVDLEGRQETKLRTIWEPAYIPESKRNAEPTTGSPSLPSTVPPPQAYYNVGRQLQTLGLYDDAIHYFEEALKRDKTFGLAAQAVAECTSYAQVQKSGVTAYNVGRQLQDAGLLPEAIESYKKPLPPADLATAEKAWKTLLKLPCNGHSETDSKAKAALDLARLYKKDQVYLFEESLELYKAAVAHGSLEAAKELERTQQAGAAALTEAGEILYGLVQYDAAENYLLAALAKVPADHKAQAALAKVKQSRPPEAHKDALPFYTLGQFYEQRGALDEARTQYENALRKQPDYEAAQEAFKRALGKRETIEDRYLDLIEQAARWLAIELSRRSLEKSEQSIGRHIKLLFDWIRHHSKHEQRPNYQAQLYNFIGSFHLTSAFTYRGEFFYQEAIDLFKQAIASDKLWFQPYENLADAYVLQLEEWLLGKRSLLSAYLALSLSRPKNKGIPSARPAPWPGALGEGRMDGHKQLANYLYEALTNYCEALKKYDKQPRDRLSQPSVLAQNNTYDPIKRRIELGICTAKLLTADQKLIDEARVQIMKMKDDELKKDDVFLYNLACWHAIVHKLYKLGDKYDINAWKTLLGDVDAKRVCTVLGYSLARNKARDLWPLPPGDPCFDGIFQHTEYERLIHKLSLKIYDLPTLYNLEGDQFKEEVDQVFKEAKWLDSNSLND